MMRGVYFAGVLLLISGQHAQAQKAYLNCHHLVTTSEERMVRALNAATNMKDKEGHPDFCKVHAASKAAINDWLDSATICKDRMDDYMRRVYQVINAKQTTTYVLATKCNQH